MSSKLASFISPDSVSQVICYQYVPPYWHLYFWLAISSLLWPSGHVICLSLDGHKLLIISNMAWFPLGWFSIFLFLLISNITHFIYLANFLNVDFHFFEDLIPREGRIQCHHWGPLLHFLLWRLSVWCASMCTPFLQTSSDLPVVALWERSSLHSRDSTQICYGQSHWQLLYSTPKAYIYFLYLNSTKYIYMIFCSVYECVCTFTHSLIHWSMFPRALYNHPAQPPSSNTTCAY